MSVEAGQGIAKLCVNVDKDETVYVGRDEINEANRNIKESLRIISSWFGTKVLLECFYRSGKLFCKCLYIVGRNLLRKRELFTTGDDK